MIPLVHREDVEMDKGKKVSEVCQNLLHPADLRSLASALSTFNEKSSKTVGLGHDGNHLNNEHKQMAKFQRYAGYEHQTPEPVIPKPDVLPDPRVVTVQDGLPILFEPCESPAVRASDESQSAVKKLQCHDVVRAPAGNRRTRIA